MFNPTLLKFGSVSIRWYGLTAAASAIAAFLYLKKIARLLKININLDNLFFYAVLAGILGARLYHVLNEFNFYLTHPELILMIWKGGLAIHGGILAGALVLFYYCRRRKLSFLRLADLFLPVLILSEAIARWGNFFNQELFGKPTNLPWGIFIDPTNRPPAFSQFNYFHPTFLYQSLWNLIAVILITVWIKKRPPEKNGLIFGVSMIAWGIGRFLVELLRIDSVPLIFGMRLPLLVSIALAITGILTIAANSYTSLDNTRQSARF
ncbi:MAG: prolipoprotein diacylglyceryl transferase [Patescibacteria group bacterium]